MGPPDTLNAKSLLKTLDDVTQKIDKKTQRGNVIDGISAIKGEVQDLRRELIELSRTPEQNIDRLTQVFQQIFGLAMFAEVDRDPTTITVRVPPYMEKIDVYEAILLFGGHNPSFISGQNALAVSLNDPEDINVLLIRLHDRGITKDYIELGEVA